MGDMLGIELYSNWSQTRRANGEIVKKNLSNTINPWKGGKFMPITSRPWSLNSFALSKVWFKCNSIDLRVGDIKAISSNIKSWLYVDLSEKPSEYIMCRPICHGGLGIISPKHRSLACLIRTFLETATNPKYKRNQYHAILYRFHVLEETNLHDPGYPPYYPSMFFAMIKKVKKDSLLNISTMTISQWTRLLVEDNLTMHTNEDQSREYIPFKAENASPNTDWVQSWHLA